MPSKSRLKVATTKPTELRSRIMRAIKAKDTGPERAVEAWLKSARFKPNKHSAAFPGKPDFMLPRQKIAIFVHGCFWHGHGCSRGGRLPKTNRPYWKAKLANNMRRDARNASAIRRMGWSVLTVWECAIEQGTARKRMLDLIKRRSARQGAVVRMAPCAGKQAKPAKRKRLPE